MKFRYVASSVVDAGTMGINHWLHVVLWLFLCLLLLSPLHAEEPTLKQWRQQLVDTRKLADNDPVKAYETVQTLQETLPDDATPADRIRALNVLTRCEVYLALTEPAAEHAGQALALAKKHHDRTGQVEAQLNIAINAVNRGEVGAAIAAANDNAALLDSIDRPDLQAEAMLRLMMAYFRLKLFDESVTIALQNMEIARQSNEPLAMTYAYQGLALSYEQSGHYQKANNYYQKMREASRQARSKLWEGHAMVGLAGTLRQSGDDKAAERLFQEAISLFRQAKFPFSLAYTLFGYADLLSGQQRYAEAIVVLEEEVGILQQHHNRIGLWFTLNAYADNLQKLGRKAESQAYIEKAYQLATDIGFPHYIEASAQRMATVAAERGDYQRAYRYIAEATQMAERYAREKAGNRIVELTERYKTESKQRQIDTLNLKAERHAAALKQQQLQYRLLWTILAASLILFLASVGFLLKLRRSNLLLSMLNREVQASQNKLQATLDAIPDLLFVVDLNGTIHEFHSPRADLLLMPPEQFLGRNLAEVLPPEAVESSMQALHEAKLHGSSLGKQIKLPLADETRWLELSVARKSLHDGEVRQFIVLSRDISERQKMQQALAASEQQFRALVENSPDGIVRYDREGRRIYLNPAMEQALGHSKEVILGKKLDDWALPRFDDNYRRQLENVIETGEDAHLVMKIKIADGKEIYSDVRFAPEFDMKGRIASVLAVGRDITALKQAEQAIEEAYAQIRELALRKEDELEEERKRIARDMHDELGQYLTTLRMNFSVLRMQPDIEHEKLEQQLQMMMSLLDDTIQVVRKIASQLRPAQLQAGITVALEWLVEEFSDTTGIACNLETDCDETQINEGLAIAIFRIVQESLTNVARYAQATAVDVCLQVKENGYYLQVRDNGMGFEPDAIQGKSFGLLGMRERAANLGGGVDVISATGQGTIIEVLLPVRDSQEAS